MDCETAYNGLGKALRDLARSDEAQKISKRARFYDSGRPIRSYTEGGCLVFAEAFARWAGPGVELLSLNILDDIAEPSIEHVVAKIGDFVFDADGCKPIDTVWDRAVNHSGGWIGPFNEQMAHQGGVGCDLGPLRSLVALMRQRLRSPSDWGIPREPTGPSPRDMVCRVRVSGKMARDRFGNPDTGRRPHDTRAYKIVEELALIRPDVSQSNRDGEHRWDIRADIRCRDLVRLSGQLERETPDWVLIQLPETPSVFPKGPWHTAGSRLPSWRRRDSYSDD